MFLHLCVCGGGGGVSVQGVVCCGGGGMSIGYLGLCPRGCVQGGVFNRVSNGMVYRDWGVRQWGRMPPEIWLPLRPGFDSD